MGRREAGGRLVREVWIEWAREQPDPKPSWLVPWEALSESDREVDRRIAERVRAEAVQETADAWQQGGWTVLSRKYGIAAIGIGQVFTDWLRARARDVDR